jgi:hypothetical protein
MAQFKLNKDGKISQAKSDELLSAIYGLEYFGEIGYRSLTPNQLMDHLILLDRKPIQYKIENDVVHIYPALIEYKVVKNTFYGDYRIVKLINGEFDNEFDGNWSESQANEKCKQMNDLIKK